MKYHYFGVIILAIVLSCSNQPDILKDIDPSVMLWYDEPATAWTEALALGNGRMGAMVFGGTESEMIQFNEETLWSGQPHDYANKGSYQYLEELRRLLWEGRQDEAHQHGNMHFMSQPFGQQSYLPFGNILLDFPGHKAATVYHRRLDLNEALSLVTYEVEGVKYRREVFTTAPGRALVARIESSRKGMLNFSTRLNSPHSVYDVTINGDEIILKGKANNYHQALGHDGKPYPESRLNFEARLRIINEGGEIVQKENLLEVVNANSATLLLVAATSFVNYHDISANPSERCVKDMSALTNMSYKALKKEHLKDYQKLFQRVSLDLGKSELSMRPTDERIVSFMQDEDPGLVALLFQFGRYLLISSSRPGTQPANLQGIWNDKLAPPWDSKYTININTEMNYWPAEVTNLSECALPLLAMVEDLSVTGRSTAREHYNLDGWVTHHNTDLWRGAAPINNANHGIWVTGGAWLCQHVWWHYQYSGDVDYLRNKAYPILKEASRFFTGYLTPWPGNPEWLVSGPSNSPEIGGLVMGPAMDHQIIRDLFANTIEAAGILGVDSDFVNLLKETRARIAPNQVGQHGQLQEWLTDLDDPDNTHRHVSHLWGLHPGSEIHPDTTPELAEACRVTLKHRGDAGTGWSRAWKINFWARLLDGDYAFKLLRHLIILTENNETNWDKGGLYLNMLDACPPFQIDGNFGATSGIAEMLLQTHMKDKNGNYIIHLLPAIPSAWPQGNVKGLRARGGAEVDIVWKNSNIVSATIKANRNGTFPIRYRDKTLSVTLKAGEKQLITDI